MEIATSQSLSRLWRPALIGVATAFAWIVLSLLLGFGSGQAHAEDDDDNGLLGAVTTAVDKTASTVTETVTAVTSATTETVKKVAAVAPAPVQQPVKQVAQTVSTVVSQVTKPVEKVVSEDVVSTVTKPVVEVVKSVPVVGDAVSGLGVDEAVEELGSTVDDTLGGLTDAVVDSGSTIGGPSAGSPGVPPVVPGVPSLPRSVLDGRSEVGATLPATADASPATVGAGDAASDLLTSFEGVYEPGSASSSIAVPSSTSSSGVRGPLAPAGGLCPPTASSSGPGGAGPGAWALVALGPLAALRAWVRRAGPEDEHAPPAPAGSTDVSPD